MIEPASNEYKIKIQELWTATQRDALLLTLKQCYAQNRTLAECAELVRAAIHDGLVNGLRVVDMLPMANVVPAQVNTTRHREPLPRRQPRRRRSTEEQAGLESAVFDRILGSRAPVTVSHLVRVIEPHFERIDQDLVRAILRKLTRAGRVQQHPTQRSLWMHRPQGATTAAPMLVRKGAALAE